MKNDIQLKQLQEKVSSGSATNEEILLLNAWYNSLAAAPSEPIADEKIFAAKDRMWAGIESNITPVVGKRSFKLWYRIAAAAIVVVSLGIGILYFGKSDLAVKDSIAVVKDINPGKQGATLTLANGSKIRLSDAVNGALANEAGVTVSKIASGQLVYQVNDDKSNVNAINTLSTSNGETYQVKLPDGSMVWLNAASSLTYSANLLKDGKRMVELSGEGYFEVAKDKLHPFIVKSAGQEVEVLGTHFNINSYADEGSVRTTLLEGSVKVSGAGGKSVIRPGQQAVLSGGRISVGSADVDQVVGWKDGDFVFAGEDLQSVMRQVARWYDVEVVYQGEIKKSGFYSNIPRSRTLSQILRALEMNQGVKFKVEGRRVVVMQ